ncbi:MAG: 4Fe-4S dicluster domain-containing protein [Actinomycetia bacterium]|nr:4Fe-4S dicluster domain-containing protein [Actinomycetes bacterium]
MSTPPPLTPMGLDVLLGRIAHEWESRGRIFDLPTARYWKPADDVDLSYQHLGRPAATPIGPAAGPHSQMAQNIVLAWLGGSRLIELKTVQVMDDLEIARPCIDMQTIGYNIEWSQELEVAQSLEEYVKAWMILEILGRWEPLTPHLGPDPGPHLFDLSVGYDLAGIQSDKVAGFIRDMGDASAEIERLRPLIPEPFAQFRDHEFPTLVSDTVTLSTFHGCPPDEIEAITKHLVDAHDVDVIVKLNPTLLGYDRVNELLHDTLGYGDVTLVAAAFDEDLQFDRGIELIESLNEHAREGGRRFGIKLTNTLVVANHKQWMPEDRMYLSGPPLHVLATALLDKLCAALPGLLDIPGHDGDVQVSFSAGVTKENLANSVAMGVRPATVCSDLLKPGGYGRLAPMLRTLTEAVRADEAATLGSFGTARHQQASAAGHRDPAAHHLAQVLGENLGRYHLTGNEKLPRAVDHELEMWGCVACNLCVTVCPNDAFFKLPTGDVEGLEGRHQYLVFTELCNECGNCMTFCPEQGDPAMVKPRLFLDPGRYATTAGPRFLLSADGRQVVKTDQPPDDVGKLTSLLGAHEGSPLAGDGDS